MPQNNYNFSASETPKSESIREDLTDYTECDILLNNSRMYFAGYLLKKCLKVHTCGKCEDFIQNQLDETTYFCNLKAYSVSLNNPFGKSYFWQHFIL